MKHILLCLLIVTAVSSCTNVAVYNDEGYRVAYHKDWPTYGLYAGEFSIIAELILTNKNDEAVQTLQSLIDRSVIDANNRLETASEEDKEEIQKIIKWVADFRTKNPRENFEVDGRLKEQVKQNRKRVDLILKKYSTKTK